MVTAGALETEALPRLPRFRSGSSADLDCAGHDAVVLPEKLEEVATESRLEGAQIRRLSLAPIVHLRAVLFLQGKRRSGGGARVRLGKRSWGYAGGKKKKHKR
eukprot:RCo046673